MKVILALMIATQMATTDGSCYNDTSQFLQDAIALSKSHDSDQIYFYLRQILQDFKQIRKSCGSL